MIVRSLGLALLVSASALAAPKVLVLSGGGGPHGNHFSQYLQTKLLADELRGIVGDERVTVRFAAGNDFATRPTLYDVHRRVRDRDGFDISTTVPGKIVGNAPATKAQVLDWFENGADVAKEENFFLFVTDHGEPNEGDTTYSDNCIGLWGFDAENLALRPFSEACLSVSELSRLLRRHVHGRKSVFAMTQCFSGGFHQMSVRNVGGFPTADVDVCGFTAVTPDTTASGCTADVDGPGYKGYERYLAQQLTGIDVVTGKPMPYVRKATLREAHFAAALEDTAKDIPFTTTDYYLTAWADALENNGFQLRNRALTPEAAEKLYRAALDAGSAWPGVLRSDVWRSAVDERLAYLKGQTKLLAGYDPETKHISGLPFPAFLARLEAVNSRKTRLENEADLIDKVAEMLWRRYGFEPWKAALESGQVKTLDEVQTDFERAFLLAAEMAGQGLERSSLFRMAVWGANDRQRSEALGGYLARREGLRDRWLLDHQSSEALAMLAVAQSHRDERDRRARQAAQAEERYDQLRRLYFTRRQIAAATVLAASGDKKAELEYAGLDDCERTPF